MVGTVVGRILDDSSFSKWEWTGVDLVTDIVVVGNKITFRNASFRLPTSFPTNYTTLPISLPSLTNAVVPSCHSLVYSLLG